MSEFEFRAVTEFLILEGREAKEIHKELVKVYKGDAASLQLETVELWVNDFKSNRNSLDGKRSMAPKPKNAPSDENVHKVHDLLMKDQRIKETDINKTSGISKVSVHHIINDVLAMKKVHGKWVSKLLTKEQRNNRVQVSQKNVQLYKADEDNFLKSYITVTEEWLTFGDEKIRTVIFWDAKGVVLIDFLGKGKTMNGVYYAGLLDQLVKQLTEKRPHLADKEKHRILFHQSNGQVQNSVVVMEKVNELKFELLEQPPHSPDLSPSDYHLYPNLEKFFKGKRFDSIADFVAGINRHFDGYAESYYKGAITALEKKYEKCIELQGEYLE